MGEKEYEKKSVATATTTTTHDGSGKSTHRGAKRLRSAAKGGTKRRQLLPFLSRQTIV
jgi:hypothetical protein